MALARLLPIRIYSQSRSGLWPWMALATTWLLTATGVVMLAMTYTVSLGPRWGPRWVLAVFAMVFAPMGAVVASRQPRNIIGWIYGLVGVLAGVQFFAQEYAVLALLGRPGWLPGGEWAAWLQSWTWVPIVGLYLGVVPLLLPEGHLPSPRWRPLVVWASLATVLMAISFAFQPGRLVNFYPVINPLGASQAQERWLQFQFASMIALYGAIMAAAASLFWRIRHSSALVHQQLKWVALAFALAAVGVLSSIVFPALSSAVFLAAIVGMQATTGIAILRYRLYDLDVVLNRTVVYGVLTAALVGIYFGSVVLLQGLAVAFTGQSRGELVTVLSTLAIAALFSPLRTRIQRVIDERFFRRKYDAEKALARFGQAIRGDTSADLGRLDAHLLRVVDETLEPETVWLWTKP